MPCIVARTRFFLFNTAAANVGDVVQGCRLAFFPSPFFLFFFLFFFFRSSLKICSTAYALLLFIERRKKRGSNMSFNAYVNVAGIMCSPRRSAHP